MDDGEWFQNKKPLGVIRKQKKTFVNFIEASAFFVEVPFTI